ncbi:MAG TPA: choice-of-anchor tandem repeat GloVer-containing protein [Puia sp.]|nr:choice-of-anchor tandem repeat GloVer-containing protein [Puia sp.]
MRALFPSLLPILFLLSWHGVNAQVKMYGMTGGGGDSSAGVIFSINSDGSNYQLLYSFKGGTDGAGPRGTLAAGLDGKLYGTTTMGGLNNVGTIFAYDTLNHIYKKLADLGQTTGTEPGGSLAWYKDRWYGLTVTGGASGAGTLFSYEPISGVLKEVYDLTTTTGQEPWGGITVFNGLLYFNTYMGGPGYGGVLNVYDPDAGTVTGAVNFPLDYAPYSSPVVMNNILYGVAVGGRYGIGSVYSFDPANKTFKEIHNYYEYIDGAEPFGIQAFHGLLYVTTVDGGQYSSDGALNMVNPVTGGEAQLYSWSSSNPAPGGSPLASPTITNDAMLLCMTSGGGTTGQGVLFSYDLHSNTYTKLLDFTGPNGAGPGTCGLLIPGQLQILPLRIVRFAGLLTGSGRVLNWTATETGSGGWFELERSVDEVNFAAIDSVAAEGGADAGGAEESSASYAYTDDVALPGVKVAYYRLKMTNANQEVSYSNIVAIELGTGGGDSLQLINTAVHGTAFLQYTSAGASGTLNVRVVGMNGALWIQQVLPVSAGVNSYSINTTALPKGMYVLQAAGRSIKFMKL